MRGSISNIYKQINWNSRGSNVGKVRRQACVNENPADFLIPLKCKTMGVNTVNVARNIGLGIWFEKYSELREKDLMEMVDLL